MRALSPRIFADLVRLCPLTEAENDGGGKVIGFAPAGDVLRCRVTRLNARVKTMAEYEATETTYELAFPAPRPAARIKDQLAWLLADGSELGRLTVSSAPKPHGPDGGLWVLYAVTIE